MICFLHIHCKWPRECSENSSVCFDAVMSCNHILSSSLISDVIIESDWLNHHPQVFEKHLVYRQPWLWLFAYCRWLYPFSMSTSVVFYLMNLSMIFLMMGYANYLMFLDIWYEICYIWFYLHIKENYEYNCLPMTPTQVNHMDKREALVKIKTSGWAQYKDVLTISPTSTSIPIVRGGCGIHHGNLHSWKDAIYIGIGPNLCEATLTNMTP